MKVICDNYILQTSRFASYPVPYLAAKWQFLPSLIYLKEIKNVTIESSIPDSIPSKTIFGTSDRLSKIKLFSPTTLG